MADTETPAPAGFELPSEIRVFVNETGVSIPRHSSALEAVRAHSETAAADVAAGRARLTDSRGLPMMPDAIVNGGHYHARDPVRDRGDQSAGATSDGTE